LCFNSLGPIIYCIHKHKADDASKESFVILYLLSPVFINGGRVQIFGTTLTNKNSVQEEIKSRLKSGKACYHSVQNLFSSSLLSKEFKD